MPCLILLHLLSDFIPRKGEDSVCQEAQAQQTEEPVLHCSKAVRQYGEVKNGHNFKRPPSMRCMARYRAIAATWLQTYAQHQVKGTLPADVHGAPLFPLVAMRSSHLSVAQEQKLLKLCMGLVAASACVACRFTWSADAKEVPPAIACLQDLHGQCSLTSLHVKLWLNVARRIYLRVGHCVSCSHSVL